MVGAMKTITINFVAGLLLMFSAISTVGGFTARLGTYGGFPATSVMRELSLIPGPKMIGMLLAQASNGRSYNDEVINGIGYSARYPGATLDVRVNACIIDAEKLTNGNTSGVCDSSGEGGAQTIAAQINVGDTKGDVATWILPSYCLWGITIKDGTSSAIYQYSLSRIIGVQPPLRCELLPNTAGLYTVYQTNGASNGAYYTASDFFIYNYKYHMSSGYAMMITGGDDGSSWTNIYVGDYNSSDTAAVYVTGVCCSASINHLIAGSNGSGPVPLFIAANVNGLDLRDISLTDPKPGTNVMTIGRNDTLSFTGVLYIEGPHADTSTTHITIANATAVHFDLIEDKAEVARNAAHIIDMTGAFKTVLTISGFSASQDGNWVEPITLVSDSTPNCSSSPCITSTDSRGDYSTYASTLSSAQNFFAWNGHEGTNFTFDETSAAPVGVAGKDVCKGVSTTHTINCSFNDGTATTLLTGSAIVGLPAAQNITAVTVNANSTSAQLLQEIALSSGVLNNLNQTFLYDGTGIYTNGAGQMPTLSFAVYLCTTSRCGSSGTLLLSGTTGATASASGHPWRINGSIVTAAIGTSGQLWASGNVLVDLGARSGVSQAVYQYPPKLSSTINLTGSVYLDVTVAASTNGTGNAITQNMSILTPQSNPVLSGSTASVTAYTVADGASNASLTADKIQLIAFTLPYQLTFSKIVYIVGSADDTSDLYDIGVYEGSPGGTGTLVCDSGAMPGTTFAPTANTLETVSCEQSTPITIPAGRYYEAITAATAKATLSASTTLQAAHGATITTSGGALPGRITLPSDSWVNSTQYGMALHN
jgi:hypothetical protein